MHIPPDKQSNASTTSLIFTQFIISDYLITVVNTLHELLIIFEKWRRHDTASLVPYLFCLVQHNDCTHKVNKFAIIPEHSQQRATESIVMVTLLFFPLGLIRSLGNPFPISSCCSMCIDSFLIQGELQLWTGTDNSRFYLFAAFCLLIILLNFFLCLTIIITSFSVMFPLPTYCLLSSIYSKVVYI